MYRFSGQALREKRTQADLTQAQLAEKLGRRTTTVTHWEIGRRNPAGETLPALAKALGCQMEELFRVVTR